jgi:nucleotide-binding universal stress UspA family protein
MESKYRLSVLHPTDPTNAGQVAFAHALKVALTFGAKLYILRSKTLDANRNERPFMPPVRKTLEQWKLLKEGSGQSEVFRELGLTVKKIDHNSLSATAAIAYHLESHDVDLIVFSAHIHNALKSDAGYHFMQQVMQATGAQILYIPDRVRGFVSNLDGTVTLNKILVPVVQEPHPESALCDAVALASTMGERGVTISLVHVGDPKGFPAIRFPANSLCSWNTISRQGDAADEINALAYILPADLMVITTRKRNNLNTSDQDSVTARILLKAPCPVLIISSPT